MRKRRQALFPVLLFGLLSSFAAAQSADDCLACHEDKELKAEKGASVFVDPEKFRGSVHARAEISCTDCHADLKGFTDFPHASPLQRVTCGRCHEEAAQEFSQSVHFAAQEPGAPGRRVSCPDCHGTHEIKGGGDFDSSVFPLNLPATCEKCHLEKVETEKGFEFIRQYNQSVHFKALARAGLTLSADCNKCHGSHKIKSVRDPLSLVSRKNIIQTCGTCHVGIQRDYLEGVHGKDYVKGVKDVPVCTDCHSEHDILSPENLESRVYATKVALVCSRCHDNLALGRQYGFLTSRLKTYSESFHGTAARFGETRVANCASCHGFHDIRPSADPKSSINPQNLPRTCGQCHPGASRHFAEGQVHVIPEEAVTAKYRSSTIVKNVYIIVISVIIGVMLIFILTDFLRRTLRKETHG